ncbi:MAG: glycosyltransferase, partial [Pseudomonadota bacterium]
LIVVGEGERALLQIANGTDPKEIKGVYSRGYTQDENFSSTDLIEDLDTLPFPDDTLPNMDQYYNISPRNDRTHRTGSMVTSRGCPFSCEFCSIHPVYGHRWRARSAENVLSEIEYLNKNHGINCFEIEDDNFTLQKDRTVDILEGLVRLNEKGYNLIWRTPNGIKIDTIDPDIAKLIKKSNCQEIVVALEHGDEEMLQLMNKKLDLGKAYDVIKTLVEQQIPRITIFVIVGYPGENKKRFLNGFNYLQRIKELGGPVSVWVNIAQPYPGTRLLQRCKEAGYLSDPSIDNFLVNRNLMSTEYFVQITTPDFDAQEVLCRKQMIQEVFSPAQDGTTREGIQDYLLPKEVENLSPGINKKSEHIEAAPRSRKDGQVRILLCGWYFQGNTGDDLSIEPILKTLSKYGEVRVSTTEIFDRDLIDWCDLLVIGSGSHITPRGISSYRQVKYARENGKKIIYYAQTIEGGHPQFIEHLARADLITVRDSESKKVVEANGFRAVLASDPIFKTKKRTIGFSFRRWVNEPPDIVERLASMLDNLAVDYEILSLPYTENDTDTESDTAFHEQVRQKMKNRAKQASYDRAIENVDLLIGMRLHALVCALNVGKQVLAIDYDVKIRRIFSDLGMKDRVVSYDEVDKIPMIIREKIFRSDWLALREKVNEALVAGICADIKGDPRVKVSVVMPTYNRAHYLKEAIGSILAQTMTDWELILIDDGSTDDTRELVESYKDIRIKYYNFGHNGITFSRNIGNLLSRGEIIAVADSDDVNLLNRLEAACEEMEKSQADIIYSSMFHFDDSGGKELIPSHPFSYERLKEGNFIYHPTVTYRHEVAMICPYNENLEMVEDYHMYLQAAKKGYKFHQVEEPLVMHRLHDEQISSTRSEEMAEIHRRLVDSEGKKIKKEVEGQKPLVSVIVPTYKRPDMLKEALTSVLSQTYQNFEVIVVNDAGDDVKDVIDALNKEGKIIYLQHKENRGLPAARNTGLKAAKGKYIAYLDDDDIYYPNHLETLVGFLENNDYKVAYTDSYHAFQEWITDRYVTVGKKIIYSHDFDRQQLLIFNYIPVLNVVHRKDMIEVAGLFDVTLGAHEDWDMWIRLSQYGDFHHINIPTTEVSIRTDETTMTSRSRMPFLKTMKIIHKRYSYLVTNPSIFEEQKKAEEGLARQLEIEGKDSIIPLYEYLHRYRFTKEFVRGKKVLSLACGEGDGSFMLSEEADS